MSNLDESSTVFFPTGEDSKDNREDKKMGEVRVESSEGLVQALTEAFNNKVLVKSLLGKKFDDINRLEDMSAELKNIFSGPLGERLSKIDVVKKLILSDGAGRIDIVIQHLKNSPKILPVRDIEAITDESGLREKIRRLVVEKYFPVVSQENQQILR